MTFEEWCMDKITHYADSGCIGAYELKELYNLGFEEGYNKGFKSGEQAGYAKAVSDANLNFMEESGE